jgi:hypothetical protein
MTDLDRRCHFAGDKSALSRRAQRKGHGMDRSLSRVARPEPKPREARSAWLLAWPATLITASVVLLAATGHAAAPVVPSPPVTIPSAKVAPELAAQVPSIAQPSPAAAAGMAELRRGLSDGDKTLATGAAQRFPLLLQALAGQRTSVAGVAPWYSTDIDHVVGAVVSLQWTTPVSFGPGLPHFLNQKPAQAGARPYQQLIDHSSYGGVTSAYVFVDLATRQVVDVKPGIGSVQTPDPAELLPPSASKD